MRVRPITRDDLTQVGAITFASFRDDEALRWLYPRLDQYPDDLRRYQIKRLRLRLVGLGQLGFVAVTEEGDLDWNGKSEVVGYAFIVRVGDDEAAKKWKDDSIFKKIERKLLECELWYEWKFLDRASDKELVKELYRLAPWDYFKIVKSHWHVSVVSISPEHQRRGIGSMLIKHAQEIGASDGLPLTLESSVAGRGMYLKNGFKTVHDFKLSDKVTDALMLWEPEELKGQWLENIIEDRARVKAGREGLPRKASLEHTQEQV